jgi:hypothetical protein
MTLLLTREGEVKIDVEPVCIGPTWQRHDTWTPANPVYLLPEHLGIKTLGWSVLTWITRWLIDPELSDVDLGILVPWRPTDEQIRFILWYYALDERGRFMYRKVVLQRLKGWGKDPLAAVLALVELCGPCRFKEWGPDGEPVGKENPTAYIQIAAVSLDQTHNTMDLFAGMMSPPFIKRYAIDPGKTLIYARGGRKIKAVTSSPASLQGNRPSFVILNETHEWNASNDGHAMLKVINNNATKSKGGAARQLSITNAYEPSEGSVAQVQREAWQAERDGLAFDTGVLYDSLEAPADARVRPKIIDENTGQEALDGVGDPIKPPEELIRAYLTAVVTAVRGDASWLDVEGIVASVLDVQNTPSSSRRFWFNQVVAAEDAWVDPAWVDSMIDPKAREERITGGDPLRLGWDKISREDACVMFGDGSKADDATGLVLQRISDGYTVTIGVWQKPKGLGRDQVWRAPRGEVDSRVDEAFARFNIVGFLFDPSHTKDDVDSTPYWNALIDDWHRRYADRLQYHPMQSGDRVHSVMWDMTSPLRQGEFVAAAERVREEIKIAFNTRTQSIVIDGHPALVDHLRNAKAAPGKYGTTLMKEHRESAKKIDLAVCLVGATMLRRFVLNKGLEAKPSRTVWW